MLWRFFRDRSGSAAVEIALVIPLLMPLLFGAFDLGYYFFCNHVVAKAVRDGARYASRQPFGKYTCPSSVDSTVRDNIRNVTRTDQVTSGGTPRLGFWSSASTVTVSVRCYTADYYGGIYEDMWTTGIPIVTVSATVPYRSLFSLFGFRSAGINLHAQS